MERLFNVAVLGATGAVGETILELLESRKFPIGNLYPLASSNSAGQNVRVNGKNHTVEDVEDFDWSQVEIALFSAGGSVSKQWAPIAAQAGCVVIDNTSCFRYDDDIPLVVPEVNAHALSGYTNRNIIANPNCSTIQMMLALKPIHDEVGIARINVCTYQSVSGSGKKGINELAGQTARLLNGKGAEPELYPRQIAFNVIPQIDDFQDNGYTKEEMKMVWETQKILEDASIMVNPTAVRVPVFYGHAEALHIETRYPLDIDEVASLLNHAPGVKFLDKNEDFPTQISHGTGKDDVFVGRLRKDISHENGINMWVVADNVRKGAATNAVQIAETLIQNYL